VLSLIIRFWYKKRRWDIGQSLFFFFFVVVWWVENSPANLTWLFQKNRKKREEEETEDERSVWNAYHWWRFSRSATCCLDVKEGRKSVSTSRKSCVRAVARDQSWKALESRGREGETAIPRSAISRVFFRKQRNWRRLWWRKVKRTWRRPWKLQISLAPAARRWGWSYRSLVSAFLIDWLMCVCVCVCDTKSAFFVENDEMKVNRRDKKKDQNLFLSSIDQKKLLGTTRLWRGKNNRILVCS